MKKNLKKIDIPIVQGMTHHYRDHTIVETPTCFYVATMPRTGGNEFGFRYFDNACAHIDSAFQRPSMICAKGLEN